MGCLGASPSASDAHRHASIGRMRSRTCSFTSGRRGALGRPHAYALEIHGCCSWVGAAAGRMSGEDPG
jgi:hypothetical protein